MKNEVLYRKYRPKNFKEVLGQDHIVKALLGAVKADSISHAYLFAGSRGTGKTSIARIFATEIGTSSNDLYEIDAASNRNIDDVRALRDAVLTLPFESKYKVYILDEVHMLTKEAWNAFLKTLEEPPKHVIFILATTDIDKVPDTIISRCQVFTFKRPSAEILKESVLAVAKSEDVSIEPASAELIALLGDGSFRDSYGILQKIIVSSKKSKITLAEVEEITGAPKSALVGEILSAIANKDTDKAFKVLETIKNQNIDVKMFIELLLFRMRAVLLSRYSPVAEKSLENDLSKEDFEIVKTLAHDKNSTVNSLVLIELLKAFESTGKTPIPTLPLEIAILKITKDI